MQWAMDDSLYRIQQALRGLLRNMPLSPLAWLMRLLIFPTGLPFHKPTDRLDHKVARSLLVPGEVRDRLTRGVYTHRDPRERIGQLEQALTAVAAATPHEKTLRRARIAGQLHGQEMPELIMEAVKLGILSEDDKKTLEEADRLRNQVIQVNAFEQLTPMRSNDPDQSAHMSKIDTLGAA
jgi:acyl-CoA dehydrogenase